MDLLWQLLARMQAVPLNYAWMFKRSDEPELRDCISTDFNSPRQLEVDHKSVKAQTRMIERISIGEFMMVLAKCRNLVVIDLRSDKQFTQFPAPTATVIRVRPHELVTVLERVPPDRTLVLCGASNFSTIMIEASPCMHGYAPLYVLEGDLRRMEVA